MAWFKHEVGMFDDRKVKKLRRKCGFIGYGLWCFILEQVAKEGTHSRLSPDYSVEDIAIDTELEAEKVKSILSEMSNVRLIHKEIYEKTGTIVVPQFHLYYDDYHKRVRRNLGRTVAEHSSHPRKQDREIDRKIERYNNISNNNKNNDSLIKLSKNDPVLKTILDKVGIK